jgi:hypothetical protein
MELVSTKTQVEMEAVTSQFSRDYISLDSEPRYKMMCQIRSLWQSSMFDIIKVRGTLEMKVHCAGKVLP